jgi:hypothetical protein
MLSAAAPSLEDVTALVQSFEVATSSRTAFKGDAVVFKVDSAASRSRPRSRARSQSRGRAQTPAVAAFVQRMRDMRDTGCCMVCGSQRHDGNDCPRWETAVCSICDKTGHIAVVCCSEDAAASAAPRRRSRASTPRPAAKLVVACDENDA